MMQQQAIVIKRKITIPGQHDYFQIVLPKDISHLIGLEYGFNDLSMPRDFTMAPMAIPTGQIFEVKWNYLKGQLSLMVPGCENIFFQEDILMDKNIKHGETVAGLIWEPHPASFGAKRHEYPFRVAKTSTLLEGFYKDAYRNDPGNFFPYILRIYLWTEKCGL